MTDSRFTSTALGAIRSAQENAARLGHSYVGSEHLLLGLASQEYSPAAKALSRAGGLSALIDREDKRVKEHPACYYDRDSLLLPAVLECPWLLKAPIVRCGNRVTVGYQPDTWTAWLEEQAKP